jgi:rhamnosyltransferase
LDGLCAVTVTYNPDLEDRRLETQIRQLRGKVNLHVIVDNGSANLSEVRRLVEALPDQKTGIAVLPLAANFGIGRALNEGVRLCCQDPATRWILTLDQDTLLAEDAFSALESELDQIPNVAHAGIIALNYSEHRFNRMRPYNRSGGPSEANSVITSGSIVNRRVFDSARFDEGLFLYYVDIDFCHRVRRLGFPIYILRRAFIDHREGSKTFRGGRTLYYLDPPRLFFVCRNGVWIFRRYRSFKALLVAFYLVSMNCIGGAPRRDSLRFAFNGFLASFRPDRHPPPFGESPR